MLTPQQLFARLAELGEVRTPSLADLFIALMAPSQGEAE